MKKSEDRPNILFCLFHFAGMISTRSTCSRLQTGCLIVSPDFKEIFSYGYNGNAQGLPNKCDCDEEGNCGCIHSEVNALIKVRTRSQDLIMISTHSPCLACAKLIINSNIKIIYFRTFFRDREPIKLLLSQGIRVERILFRKSSEPIFSDPLKGN